MGRQLFSNNAATTMVGVLSQGGTTLNVVTGTGDQFPNPTGGDYFLVTLYETGESGQEVFIEVVKCTARVGDQLTIERDFEDMTNSPGGFAYPSAVGSTVYVQLRWTAAGADAYLQKGDNLDGLANAAQARANLGISAANTPFTPSGNLAATNVQAALSELDNEKQPASSSLTSFAGLSSNADKLAYFTGQNVLGITDLSAFGRQILGLVDGTAGRTLIGIENVDNTSDATKWAATATLTNKTFNLASNTLVATSAQLAAAMTDETGSGSLVFANSPTLTGTPLAPTAAADTNTTQIASTAFVIGQGYLKASTAASTYLSQSAAASNYLTQTNAAANYLSLTSAASTYLTQANAASNYQAVSAKGQANGYAGLDSTGKVPAAQLPSFVDDVIEGANLGSFPATGETGKIYVAVDTNKSYRWTGTIYTEISASPGSTDAVAEGSTNLYFTNARARAAISVTQNLSYNATTGVITGPNLSSFLTGNQTITVSGDATGSGATAIALTLANSGVTAGSYSKVTVDAKGRVTAGSSITSSDITTALGITPATGNGSLGSTDLNTVTTSGMYRFDAPTANGPGFTYGQLVVMHGGGDTITQIAGDYNSGTLATRSGNPTSVGGAGTWKAWRAILDALNYTDYTVTKTGSGASGTWAINITGNAATATTAATCTGNAASVTISYSNDSNSTYQMLWGSGNSVYGTAGIYCNPSTDYLYASSFTCGNWHRSTGATGWYNETYGGGINMEDATYVRVYGGKSFYSPGSILAGGDVTAYSDETLKTDWAAFSDDFVEQLATVKSGVFTRIDSGNRQVGVGAQSLQTVMPNAVSEGPDGKLTVAYGNAALASVVELAKRILALEAEVKALRG